MHQVLQRELFKRVDYERRCASEGGGGLIAVTLERTASQCMVLCQVPPEEMARLKTGARVAFAYEDGLGCVKWKYQPAVVGSFSGTRIELSTGWPEESWPNECLMRLWSNESEFQNLFATIDIVLKDPSWLRHVLCENLEAEQYEQRCTVQDDDPSRLQQVDKSCYAQAAAWGLNDRQRSALFRSKRSKLLLVQGPPGTGKTKMAAALVHAHGGASAVVLMAAANKAVDNLILRVLHIFFCHLFSVRSRGACQCWWPGAVRGRSRWSLSGTRSFFRFGQWQERWSSRRRL